MSGMLDHGAYADGNEDEDVLYSSEEEEEETDAGLGIVEDDDDGSDAEVELAYGSDVDPGANRGHGAAAGGGGAQSESGFWDTGHCYAFLERRMGWSEDECSGEAMDEVLKSAWRDGGGGLSSGAGDECVVVWQHRTGGGWFKVALPGGHKQAQWLLGLGWKEKLQRFCEMLDGSSVVSLRGPPPGMEPTSSAAGRGGGKTQRAGRATAPRRGRPGSAPPPRSAAPVAPQVPAPSYIDVDPWQWSARDVGQWLGDIGLRPYAKNFLHHGVTGRVLLRLTERKIKEDLEVRKLGDRECLLEELEELQDIAGPQSRAGGHPGASSAGRRPQSAREGRVAKSAARLEAEKRRGVLERELPRAQQRLQQAERDVEEATRRRELARTDLERLMEKLRAVHREVKALSAGDDRLAAGLQMQQSSFLAQDAPPSMMSQRSREIMSASGSMTFEQRMESDLKSRQTRLREKEKLLRDVRAEARGLDEAGITDRHIRELNGFLVERNIPSDISQMDDVDWLNDLFAEHGLRLGLSEDQVRQLRHFSTAAAKLKGVVGTLKRLEFESRLAREARKSEKNRQELKAQLREQASNSARSSSRAKKRVFVWTRENCLSYVTKTLRWKEAEVTGERIDRAIKEGMPDPATRLNLEGNSECLIVGPFYFPHEKKIVSDEDERVARKAAAHAGQVLMQNPETKAWELECKTVPLGGGKNKADWLLLLRFDDKLREFSKTLKDAEFLKRLDAGERKKQAWLEDEIRKSTPKSARLLPEQRDDFEKRYREDLQHRKDRRAKLLAEREVRERQEMEQRRARSLNNFR